MNPRSVIEFFRTPVGAFAGFCILLAIGLIVAHHFRNPAPYNPLKLIASSHAPRKPQLEASVHKNMDPYNPPLSASDVAASTAANNGRTDQKPLLPPISLFDDEPSGDTKPLSPLYAPFGRLVPCELVVTVDSSTIRTPIIGLVTEDIYYDGHLIIPAGTEVHGVAQVDRERERIGSDNKWTLVLQDGQELSLTGIALDRDTDKITTEGRKAALDLRVLRPQTKDHPESKATIAADKIFEIWKDTTPQRSTQLVFCDLSTPSKTNRGFCLYHDLKAKLMQRGIPTDEIAFIQDFDSDVQKHVLFKDVKSGKVRVLIGSTQKMGTGTNVQERLIAEHHLDPPWRPADVEQRDGRILRQGNQNPIVQIYRYVTEGSFDAYMWQTLETKSKFIYQVMNGDSHIRHIEDIDSRALTFAEIKAIASGNPLVMEKATVDAEITRLTRLHSQHTETQFRIRNEIRHLKEAIPAIRKKIENLQLDIGQRISTRGEAFTIVLEKDTIEDRATAGETLIKIGKRIAATAKEHHVGSFAGFPLYAKAGFLEEVKIILKGHEQYSASISDSHMGTIRTLEHIPQNFEHDLNVRQKDLAEMEKRQHEFEAKLGLPFEHEAKLETLLKKQKELEDALDITKNQAANSLAAEETEVQTVKETEGESIQETPGKISHLKNLVKMRVAMTH